MEPFKNFFSPQLVSAIAAQLERHLTGFDRAAFESAILAELPRLELKQRSQLIADQLHAVLPAELGARYAVMRAMLHPEEEQGIESTGEDRGLRGWAIMPLCAVVGHHGLADFEGSLELLREMTKRFSSEFDVRHYLLADQERALRILARWVDDPSHHVRRLVSEGTRPRLPWAMRLPRLIADPTPILPLLEALRDDDEEYVRRSVANSLNDIAKDHPDRVAALVKAWYRGASSQRKRLLRHACRTLIKQGHPQALEVFGFEPARVELKQLTLEKKVVRLGERLVFSAELRSTARAKQALVIDYVLHFRKANGSRTPKVFKWKTLELAAGAAIHLERSHPIRPITTRRYYEGKQALSLRINGTDTGLAEFTLKVDDPLP